MTTQSPLSYSVSSSTRLFLETADRHTFLAGGLADLVGQVVDRLVARGRDADALGAADQIDDDPRARPRLAGARRALDEEISGAPVPGEA